MATLADGLDPAVLRLIDLVCRAARPAKVRVAVCGELASDPVDVPLLIGLGVEELSVSAPVVPRIKDLVRAQSHEYAQDLAARALDVGSAVAVRALS